jgi:hypothetical protein
MTTQVLTGLLLVLPAAYNLLVALLARGFDYPDILRQPTRQVLERFAAGGSRLVLTWWGFTMSAVLLAPAVVLLSATLVDAVEVTFFQTLNRYLGVAVGEHLGSLFTGLWTALAGVALLQSDLLHPLFGVVGLVLAPLFVLGSLEFVGGFEPRGWKLAGTLVPFAYIGWSVWLLALGIGLLVTA